MLQKTFIHLNGIGIATERKLWRAGILSWQDLLLRGLKHIPGSRRETVQAGVQESIKQYEADNWSFFNEVLPAAQKWRAYGALRRKALFLDIETTGLTDADSVTVIGVYNGSEYRAFVAGIDLEDAVAEINLYPLLVTFNGTGFDLPVLQRRFPGLAKNQFHIDLRYSFYGLGISGGLKKIERQLHIARSPETANLSGMDAVRLWHEYLHGCRESLELLKKYNAEDVRNLQPLLETVFRLGVQKTGFPLSLFKLPGTQKHDTEN